MDITYLGHSCFKLRGKTGVVVTDPYASTVGPVLPQTSADIITVSHHHDDHQAVDRIKGTARRNQPFVIDAPGAYELMEISIVGIQTYHDDKQGAERGKNTVMVVTIEGVKIAHLGDLGHALDETTASQIGPIDVLLIPVGGIFTIGPSQAIEIIGQLEPSYAIPMHYKTLKHTQMFSALDTVSDFFKKLGKDVPDPQTKLTVTPGNFPEETEVVVLSVPD